MLATFHQYLEPCASILCAIGATGLALGRRSAWYPLTLGCFLFGFIFLEQKFYANVALQGVFIVLNFYGIYNDYRKTPAREKAENRLTIKAAAFHLSLTVLGIVSCAWILKNHSNDPAPYIDGALTAFSILANYWMAKKYAACWIVWLLTDSAYAVLFFSWHANLTGALYVYLALLSLYGYRQWKYLALSSKS